MTKHPYKRLGLSDNPFAEYVAEKETHLANYLVRPPYLEDCVGRTMNASSFLLFGARGAGKSATRIALSRQKWMNSDGDNRVLVVTMDDFASILNDGLKAVSAASFIRRAGFHVVEAVLLWLSSLEDRERETYLQARDSDEDSLCKLLVDSLYMSQPAHERTFSASKTAETLEYSLSTKVLDWTQHRWTKIANLVAAIATMFQGAKSTGSDSELFARLKGVMGGTDEVSIGRFTLTKLVEFVRIFGFAGVVVLLDKLDETSETSSSAEATSKLIRPLLSNVPLLEVEGFGWGIFLWDRVAHELQVGEPAVRLDKISRSDVTWSEPNLKKLVDMRVAFFSEGKRDSMLSLLGDSEEGRASLDEVLALSMRSPRALVRILDTVMKEYLQSVDASFDEIDSVTGVIDLESVTAGLDAYATISAQETYPEDVLRQVVQLALPRFANKDVQARFKIGAQAARTRIQKWLDVGVVALTGTRPAEGDAGGKPANEYSITDARVRRIVERSLSLGQQFDLSFEDSDVAESE